MFPPYALIYCGESIGGICFEQKPVSENGNYGGLIHLFDGDAAALRL